MTHSAVQAQTPWHCHPDSLQKQIAIQTDATGRIAAACSQLLLQPALLFMLGKLHTEFGHAMVVPVLHEALLEVNRQLQENNSIKLDYINDLIDSLQAMAVVMCCTDDAHVTLKCVCTAQHTLPARQQPTSRHTDRHRLSLTE